MNKTRPLGKKHTTCPTDNAPCAFETGGMVCCGATVDEANSRRTAGDPVQWARDVIEERRERLRQDHEALAALVERTRAERGIARRRLAVFAIGSYAGDTSDLMAVLKRLFAGACYEVETISVLPVPATKEG